MTYQKCKDLAVVAVKKYIKVYSSCGPLHIVIGDDNYEARHIVWCMRNSISEIESDDEYIFNMDVAVTLLTVKEKDRLSVLRKAWE